MSEDFQTLLYLPGRAWVAVLVLAFVAMGPLLVPTSVGASVGLPFGPFFRVGAGVQFGCALGIGAVVVHYRRPPEGRAEGREWRYDPRDPSERGGDHRAIVSRASK